MRSHVTYLSLIHHASFNVIEDLVIANLKEGKQSQQHVTSYAFIDLLLYMLHFSKSSSLRYQMKDKPIHLPRALYVL